MSSRAMASGSKEPERLIGFGIDRRIMNCPLRRGLSARMGTGPRRRDLACERTTVNDTAETVARRQRECYAAMMPEERLRIAAAMYETARAIVVSSLPRELTPQQRRYAIARRFYGDEVSEAMLLAYAERSAAR